ncbi:MAG: hypothetical protein U0836_14015 [Pirellulales bacterium]
MDFEPPPPDRRPITLQDVFAATTGVALTFGVGSLAAAVRGPTIGWAVVTFCVAAGVPSSLLGAIVCLSGGWRAGLKTGAICWLALVGSILLGWASANSRP